MFPSSSKRSTVDGSAGRQGWFVASQGHGAASTIRPRPLRPPVTSTFSPPALVPSPRRARLTEETALALRRQSPRQSPPPSGVASRNHRLTLCELTFYSNFTCASRMLRPRRQRGLRRSRRAASRREMNGQHFLVRRHGQFSKSPANVSALPVRLRSDTRAGCFGQGEPGPGSGVPGPTPLHRRVVERPWFPTGFGRAGGLSSWLDVHLAHVGRPVEYLERRIKRWAGGDLCRVARPSPRWTARPGFANFSCSREECDCDTRGWCPACPPDPPGVAAGPRFVQSPQRRVGASGPTVRLVSTVRRSRWAAVMGAPENSARRRRQGHSVAVRSFGEARVAVLAIPMVHPNPRSTGRCIQRVTPGFRQIGLHQLTSPSAVKPHAVGMRCHSHRRIGEGSDSQPTSCSLMLSTWSCRPWSR